ncbi:MULTISPECIES: hypothetical protein [Pseudomonas]|uniref:Uncharacterized protein n=1 Tax=Pseudomonas nitroreducens TaxID=46680 RepID=A0A2D0ACY0_PSENT|nr:MULTISPECIES: hypothetical protein [Pseudomonas]MCG8906510.1 hypothetical protein [Pseudomonas sp. DP-17]OWP49478.1 hypothetical protein CEG18_18105 [Pseudomonas nitroreducens]
MAEPCQLYLKVSISRARLEAFLSQEAGSAACFRDFEQWLDGNHHRRSGLTWNELCELGQGTTAAAWVAGWSRNLRSPAWNHYDEASQTWSLGVLEFTESRDWVLGSINVLRRIADFKDLPGTDYLLIYEYLFGKGTVVAAVELTPGASRILQEQPPPRLTAEADMMMNSLLRAMDVTATYAVQHISDTDTHKRRC